MPEAVSPDSLPGEINAATRSLHTTLNRLITSRLPLALPPYTTDPTLYTTGLLHFAHIYLTFESLWTDLISSPSDPPTSPILSFLLVNPYDSPELFSSPPSPQLVQFLRDLRPKGLPRSGRLRNDLEYLTGLHPTDLSVLLAQYPGDKVAEYCTHIRQTVKHKPHVLVAYAWCFYMAVFSGGRWIRAQLANAGDEFWRTATSDDTSEKNAHIPLQEKGLSFWNFDGDQDGEDAKAEFRTRLAGAEAFFTDDERIDIIEEAKNIFTLSASLVQELDEKLGTNTETVNRAHSLEKKIIRDREEQGAVAAVQVMPALSKSAVMWFRRPEVTGAVVALGCLACVALLRVDVSLMADW